MTKRDPFARARKELLAFAEQQRQKALELVWEWDEAIVALRVAEPETIGHKVEESEGLRGSVGMPASLPLAADAGAEKPEAAAPRAPEDAVVQCSRCAGTGRVMWMWDRPNGPPGNGFGPCPVCQPLNITNGDPAALGGGSEGGDAPRPSASPQGEARTSDDSHLVTTLPPSLKRGAA